MKRWIMAGLVVAMGLQVVAGARSRGGQAQQQEVKISKMVERLKDLEKVKAEARAKKKPVAIVISEEGAKRPNLEQETQLALQRAKSLGVLIYVDFKEIKDLPQNIAPTAVEVQKELPAMIFSDPDSDKVLVAVKYGQDRVEWDRNLREAKKKLLLAETAPKDKTE